MFCQAVAEKSAIRLRTGKVFMKYAQNGFGVLPEWKSQDAAGWIMGFVAEVFLIEILRKVLAPSRPGPSKCPPDTCI